MQTPAELPEFDQVDAALERADADVGAAECHGLLCGLLCVKGAVDFGVWYGEVVEPAAGGDVLAGGAKMLLEEVHRVTAHQIDSPGLGFHLLLPEDTQSLEERTEALAEWCHGFLAGFGLATGVDQPRAKGAYPGDVDEILRDLSEIAKVGLQGEEDSEGDEAAYAEIVEYVRVGVLLIKEELGPAQPDLPRHLH
jgi:uncharacterized protein YgfB (UPF0149 family)